MRLNLKYSLLVLFAGLLMFSGCSGLDKASVAGSAARLEESSPGPSEIQSPYDTQSLLTSVMQIQYFAKSFDYFNQFAWDGDDIFPDYLFRIFGIEDSPYEEGEGTILTLKSKEGVVFFSLKKALVMINPDGSKWWQVKHTVGNDSIFYEVLISAERIPALIRYINPDTGEKNQAVPFKALAFEEALQKLPIEELRERIREEQEEELRQQWSINFREPEIIGEEVIDVGAGTFKAVHVKDVLPGESGMKADYWISPDIPGNIVKIVYSNPEQNEEYITELTGISRGNVALITESEIVELGSFAETTLESEGSPDSPVKLHIGEPHYGSVGPEGTSFYKIEVERRADIVMEVSDFLGDAELIYYGTDPNFEDWLSSSQGSTLDIQAYFTEPGTTLYFTIVDYEDEYSIGETYTINVSEEFILSTTGIMIRGDIFSRALELKSGDTYRQKIGQDGLNYYKTIVRKGPNLKIKVDNLSEQAGLRWFDIQNGSFSGAYTSGVGRSSQIEVRGVSAGTICFYYIAGNIDQIGQDNAFKITITEFGD